jgi:hypothetical protein
LVKSFKKCTILNNYNITVLEHLPIKSVLWDNCDKTLWIRIQRLDKFTQLVLNERGLYHWNKDSIPMVLYDPLWLTDYLNNTNTDLIPNEFLIWKDHWGFDCTHSEIFFTNSIGQGIINKDPLYCYVTFWDKIPLLETGPAEDINKCHQWVVNKLLFQ